MSLPIDVYANAGLVAMILFAVGCLLAGVSVLWNAMTNSKNGQLAGSLSKTSGDLSKYLAPSDTLSVEQVQGIMRMVTDGKRPDIALMAIDRLRKKQAQRHENRQSRPQMQPEPNPEPATEEFHHDEPFAFVDESGAALKRGDSRHSAQLVSVR